MDEKTKNSTVRVVNIVGTNTETASGTGAAKKRIIEVENKQDTAKSLPSANDTHEDVNGFIEHQSDNPDCECKKCMGYETLHVNYWNKLYQDNFEKDDNAEYLLSYVTLEPFMVPYIRTTEPNTPILVPGCGDSYFSAGLLEDGFENIISTDISPAVIEIMKEKFKGYSDLKWVVDDATKMNYADNSFCAIMDKSLIDCIYYVDEEECNVNIIIAKVLEEYYRVLIPGHICVIVTIRDPEEFAYFYDPAAYVPEFIAWQKEKKILPEPMPWNHECTVIRVETNDEGAIPRNVTAIDVTAIDECEDPTNSTRFYVYALQKPKPNSK